MKRLHVGRGRALCLLVLSATALAGCGSTGGGSATGSTETPPSSTTTSHAPSSTQALDPKAAALLPASIKSAGAISDGVNAAFAPFTYFSASHKIVGLDIDLANALAEALGVRLNVENTGFPNLVPGVQSGRYNMSESALSDTKTREAQVSFVDYGSDGTSLIVPSGNPHHLTLSTLCGVEIAVTTASIQEQESIPQLDKACRASGKPALKVLSVPESSDPVVALASGRALGAIVDTVSAVTAAKSSSAHLTLAPGHAIDSAPIGIAVAKGSGALQALQQAMNYLIANGTYGKVLEKWGFKQIAVRKATINLTSGA
jgi:polar amino acid transport system substrate-binding protein